MYPGKWAKEFPDKVAIIHSASGATITYRQLNERSNQLAQLMWAKGLRQGDHTAIFMENNLRYFEVMWAALRSGLNLTTVNQYLTDEEAGYIVDNCGAEVLISSQRLSEVAGALKAFAPNCHTWLMVTKPMKMPLPANPPTSLPKNLPGNLCSTALAPPVDPRAIFARC